MSSIFENKFSNLNNKKIKKEEKTRIYLPLDSIDPDPNQARKIFDEEELEKLKKSIEQDGVLQPILVRGGEGGKFGENGRYVIVCGESRYRASRLAGKTEIPVRIKNDFKDQKAIRRAQWAENKNRSNLTTEEEANDILRMRQDGLTQAEIAEDRNMSQGMVSRYESFAKRPDWLKKVNNVTISGEIESLYKKYGEEVVDWVNEKSPEEISKLSVREFKALLEEKNSPKEQEEDATELLAANSLGETQEGNSAPITAKRTPFSEIPEEKKFVAEADLPESLKASNPSLGEDNEDNEDEEKEGDFSLTETPRKLPELPVERPVVSAPSFKHDAKEEDENQEDFPFETSSPPMDTQKPLSISEYEGDTGVPVSPVEELSEKEEERIINPKLIVEFYGKRALLLLHKKPSAEDKVWIKYHADGIEAEVLGEQIKLKSLLESEK